MQRLIAAGADVNGATPGGETPLMMAARTGDPETVRALLAHGAVVDAREGWRGQTALMWAAVENNAEAIRLLLAGRRRRQGHVDGRQVHGVSVRRARRPPRRVARAARRGRRRERTTARRHERAGAGAVQRALRAGGVPARSRRRSQRGGAGVELRCTRWRGRDGRIAASTCRVRCRPGGIDSLDLVRKLVAKGAERQRPHDEGAARRKPQHAESHRLRRRSSWRRSRPTCR